MLSWYLVRGYFLYYAHVPGNPINAGTKLFQITNSPQDAASALAGTSIVGNVAAAAEYIRAHAKARTRISDEPYIGTRSTFRRIR